MGRKGCSRTSLESCKFLLGLAPNNDPYGVLLRIDYYAIRAKEFDFLRKFVENYGKELYPDE
jgi:hypothetical protein